MRESLRRAGRDESDIEYLVPTDYLSGALAAVYRSWIEGGYGDAGVDEVTHLAAAYVRASAPAIVAGLSA